jgi:ASC-1-like (ASCH) protein/ribosomal protein S18 acetylase RimI-like enzyme
MMCQRIIIREANKDDFEWIVTLMHDALEPYYGGDHRAHAKRIFDAHIGGGRDDIGFFSFEQRMFILEVDGCPAGMIHIVGKKQSTYKISPLIVSPGFQGRLGLGSRLLAHAEQYVRSKGKVRQLYCTVAKQNLAAMQFFLRKGFIKAGSSDSHYKNGIIETMLYKPLCTTAEIKTVDAQHISILPLDEAGAEIREGIRQLLLSELPTSFEGIDDDWVSALFSGYDRRRTLDVNSKYKLIFVAMNQDKRPIGVAAATPKKGSPIKIMPLIAKNDWAFEALLTDIPYQLAPYGRKLYIHINPSATQVVSLQRLGWNLDAALPSAYRPNVTTQQWSMDVNSTTMRTMRVKDEFLVAIRDGTKTLEVRVGYGTINTIQVGERIRLNSHIDNLEVKVVSIRRYGTFAEMLENEPYRQIIPSAARAADVLQRLTEFYPKNKEMLGIVVLGFRPLKHSEEAS